MNKMTINEAIVRIQSIPYDANNKAFIDGAIEKLQWLKKGGMLEISDEGVCEEINLISSASSQNAENIYNKVHALFRQNPIVRTETLAAKNLIEGLKNQTLLSIAAIIFSTVLLFFTFLAMFNNGYVFDLNDAGLKGIDGFWNMRHNAATLEALITGLTTFTFGIIYLVRLSHIKKGDEYSDAVKIITSNIVNIDSSRRKAISIFGHNEQNVK